MFLLKHSMVYFFHHYELPAILQQARIQQIIIETQQQNAGNNGNNTGNNGSDHTDGSGGAGQDNNSGSSNNQNNTENEGKSFSYWIKFNNKEL